MKRPDPRRWLALGFAGMLALAACTAAATPAPTPASTTAPSAAATAAPTTLPGTKTFTVAGPAASAANALWLATLDDLSKQGYTITTAVVQTPELVIEGVANGMFQFGSGSNNAVMTAVEKGAALKLIVNRIGNEWTLYARTDVAACAGLAGKQIAVTSLGSAATTMVKSWIAKTCPGTTPTYLIIASSSDRFAALMANQIDASPLQIVDGVPLLTDPQATGRFHAIANFQADLPDLQTNSVFVNADFAKANPGTVVATIKALLAEARKAAGNAAYLKQVILQYVPGQDQKYLDAIAKSYTDLKLFDVNGGLTQANLAYTAKYYGPAPDGTGATKKMLAVDQFADLSYLQMALDDLGKK